jgi:hypothetical protein
MVRYVSDETMRDPESEEQKSKQTIRPWVTRSSKCLILYCESLVLLVYQEASLSPFTYMSIIHKKSSSYCKFRFSGAWTSLAAYWPLEHLSEHGKIRQPRSDFQPLTMQNDGSMMIGPVVNHYPNKSVIKSEKEVRITESWISSRTM